MVELLKAAVMAFVAITLLALIGLWLWNYREEGSAPAASSETSNAVVGFLSGAVMSLVIVMAAFADFIGVMGDIIATWPAAFSQLLLGLLAIAGFSGMIEASVVSATLLVVVILVGYAAVTR